MQSWDQSLTLIDAFFKFTEEFGPDPAYTQAGRTLSYKDLRDYSLAISSYLQSREDLSPGDRIAVQIPNTLLYPIVAWGIINAGMVLVNFNPQYTFRETLKQLKDSGAKAWFCADISAHLIKAVRKECDIPLVVTGRLFELHPWPKKQIYQFVLRYRRKAIKPYSQHRILAISSLLKKSRAKAYRKPEVTPETLAMLQYTGGSSGTHMGAMLSHRNLVANMEQVRAFLKDETRVSRETLVAPLPLYHIFSFTVHCAASLLMGSHNILILDASQIKSVVRDLKDVPFTVMTGVNTLFYALMKLEAFRSLDFRSLKFCIAGGMKLDPDVARKWEELTGKPILEGFGMTELSPVASWNPLGKNKLGTIGKALPLTEMKALDEEGQTIVRPHTAGELWVRGPQVMQGYWNRPEETEKHLDREGWMRTGDLASFDEDGYWKIVGRKKRMILVSGFNVYPQEVEDVLKSHPDVVDAYVVGKEHPVNGEAVKAYVIGKSDSLSVHDLRLFCKEQLTSYKLPRQVELVAKIPKDT